jgi:LAO/AO transport system kinase
MPESDGGTEELAARVRAGEVRAVARAITLVESEREVDREQTTRLLEALLPHTGNSLRLGVSGPPGAGKSTLIDALGRHAIEQGERVAVLAVDPSSAVHGGSLLGDKTRMGRLGREPRSFIRPSPSRGAAGGVGPRTREAVLVCEAAGYSLVVVETLGVGQGEHAVAEMVDCLVLLLVPGAGDEVQAMKRGILELSDLVVMNKADGGDLARAEAAAREVEAALSLLQGAGGGTAPRVLPVSALEGRGVAELYACVGGLAARDRASGALARRRRAGLRRWLDGELDGALRNRFLRTPGVRAKLAELQAEVTEGHLLPRRAIAELLAMG